MRTLDVIDGSAPARSPGSPSPAISARCASRSTAQANARCDWTLSAGDLKLDGKLEADDGKALVAMLGLDRCRRGRRRSRRADAEGQRTGARRLADRLANSPARRPRASVPAAPPDPSPTVLRPRCACHIARADAGPLRGGTRAPLPVTFAGNVGLTAAGCHARATSTPPSPAPRCAANSRSRCRAAPRARRHRGRQRRRRRPDRRGDRHAGGRQEAARPGPGRASRSPAACSAIMRGEIALKARRADLLPRPDGARIPRHLALRQRTNSPSTTCPARSPAAGSPAQLSFRSGEDGVKAHAKILAHRRRCGEPAAVRRAAAGQRLARSFGRARQAPA